MNVSAPPPATPDTAMSSAATSGAGTPPDLAELLRGVRGVSIGLLLGLLVLGVLFQTEVAAAVQTWIVSTAYNHCFLVIPIVGYMIWDRRAELRGLTARPAPLLALGGIPIAAGWLVAERLVAQALDQHADQGASHHGEQEGEPGDGERRRAAAEPEHERTEVEAREGTEHEHIAVGEIDETQNPVHHRVAQRDERIDAALGQTVDQLLEKFDQFS